MRFQATPTNDKRDHPDGSIAATGLFKSLTGELACFYSYCDDKLQLSWSKSVSGWWTNPEFTKPADHGSLARLPITLIFPRPADDRVAITLDGVQLKTISIAWAAGHTAKPVNVDDLPTVEPITRYLEDIGKARNKAVGVISDIQMQQIGVTLKIFVDGNGGKWPQSMDEVSGLEGQFFNPRTGAGGSYLYIKPADTVSAISDPANTIIIYESKNGMPLPGGDVMYADICTPWESD